MVQQSISMKIDNVRAHREELKRLLFSIPTSKVITKTITVEMDRYKDRLGQGTVQIQSDGPSGFTHWKSSQMNPMKSALESKEYKSGEYQLIIK